MDNNTKANKATATAHRWRYRGNEGDGYQSEGKTGIPYIPPNNVMSL